MIIRRKVKLKTHQGWSEAILPHLNEKPYYEYRIAEYEAGTWESEGLENACVGETYDGETPTYIYESEIMSDEEYDEWQTIVSGTTASG